MAAIVLKTLLKIALMWLAARDMLPVSAIQVLFDRFRLRSV